MDLGDLIEARTIADAMDVALRHRGDKGLSRFSRERAIARFRGSTKGQP